MQRIRETFERYERRISAGAIVLAFLIDSFTLTRVEAFWTEFLLFLYLAVVAGGIVVINLRESGRLQWLGGEIYMWLFVFVQFSFGGLFGRFFIYYSRSASFAASWPFLTIFLALLIGNEFSKKYYTRLLLQMSFFFLAIFAFLVLFIPLIVSKIGTFIFLVSGAASLAVMYGFVRFLAWLIPERIAPRRHLIFALVGMIFVAMNVLYFANIIPPIPLALRDAGVYHSVVRAGSEYRVTAEQPHWYDFLKSRATIHVMPGGRIYVYSAVFAPANFGLSITHQWQYYDEKKSAWVDAGTVSYPIVGGSDRGYRGYSYRSGIPSGIWRVNIETAGGQVIGRVDFEVQQVSAEPQLLDKVL